MDELRAIIQESWGRAVVAASAVEDHAQAMVGKLGQRVVVAPEQAKKIAAELAERLQAHRKSLAGEVEKAVRSAVERVRLPARADLKKMAEKLEALEARLHQLERGGKSE